jgi:hypothetical protein
LTPRRLRVLHCNALAGEIGPRPGAEGETAPETLKQKDRDGLETLESRARELAPSPKEQGAPSIGRRR